MKFPVNFLAIDKELEPVAHHLRGRVLNAGCGDRDITDLLTQWNATSVDNCDITSSIPGAFLCDLGAIPRPDASYDAILCNAVLEHVPQPERVMAEFHRLLTPGGRLVVSVPFLQPFHPTPFDFRRYTRTGLEELGRSTGFRTLDLRPVHSFAQTLGWLIWAHLQESQSRLGMWLMWLPIFLASHLSQQPCAGNTYTANSFQAVFERV